MSDRYFEAIFQAVPIPMMVVDDDVRILDVNRAGEAQLGLGGNRLAVLTKRGGEALLCIRHFETPAGCGHAEACKSCAVRNSVGEAMRGGSVLRKVTRMELRRGSETLTVHVRITTAPLETASGRRVLLTLEDISDVVQLAGLLPICAWCKKVRSGDRYWQSVESYFAKHLDVDFTHSICDACYQKQLGEPLPR